MNTIEAAKRKTKYISSEHLTIMVDGKSLDELIDSAYPGENYLGMIPTLLEWLDDKNEREIVWNRINMQNHQPQVVPILMCPDDCDLWCTVIVADILRRDDEVTISRLGVDKTHPKPNEIFDPANIGKTVEWFDKIGPMTFSAHDFDQCVDMFRNALHN